MKPLAALALLGATAVAPAAAAPAAEAVYQPFPFCTAERLYVVYEASEGFALYGAAERHDALKSTITCTIRRFGTTVVASSSRTTAGPASATADVVSTPYGGMEVCTRATHSTLTTTVTIGPFCERIPAP